MEALQLDPKRLDAAFFALSDPTRRAILTRLARGEATVAELTEPFAISQPAISRHLKVLEDAGLVTRGRDAQRRRGDRRVGQEFLGAETPFLRQRPGIGAERSQTCN